jgi:ABC-2 type transport system ATP-binding protein
MNVLEVRDLSVSLKTSPWKPPRRILKKVNLHARTGEIFAFLGPNGSGKTTTIKTILGLIPEYSGVIEVLGFPLVKKTLSRIGYAPEHAYFSPYRTPREILTSMGILSKMTPELISERMMFWLDILELKERIDDPVGTFSKGMKQRLALVQSVLHDPDLIFLDEPTTGLDPLGQSQIKRLLLELKERKKTVILSSHHLLDVQEVCDTVCILGNGEVLIHEEAGIALKGFSSLEDLFVATVKRSKQ